MFPWEDFDIKARYDGKYTVQVLDIETRGIYYIVRYREETFEAHRDKLVFIEDRKKETKKK
jgi:hypothetical protein